MTQQEKNTHEISNSKAFQSEPLKTVSFNHCNITLLGTAHVSKASADKVQELIATGNYDAVAVELCSSRYKVIITPDAIAQMDLFQVIKKVKSTW
ncbi:TraB/GumN family protein [Nitrosomonas ureae]|uniref:TraB/GumN family protein n=1 Tax=Nitrosomonas ureae TaxID=44577 RepID=UPI0020D0E6B5|nr:TraB/GumN family protein [Nitrosomonas ureae]